MRPSEFYRFVQGSTVYTLTSADEAVEHNGETYEPVPIGRSNIEQTQEIQKATLKLELPPDHPLVTLHLTTPPTLQTTLTVFRDDDSTSAAVIWKGRVASVAVDKGVASIECESVFTSLSRPGLRARYQRSCRHALYGRGCNLEAEDFAVTGTVESISGAVVNVTEAADEADGWYLGGMLQASDGTFRYITGHSGKQLTLSRELDSLTEAFDNSGYGKNYGNYYGGIEVSIYPGCDHTLSTCNTKFDNKDNYGGFPWIPSKNPFGGSSIS